MMHICKGHARRRLTLLCSRFYTSHELFKLSREQGRSTPLYLEFGPNLYHPINTDSELRFVCSLLEGEIEASFSEDERCMNIDQVADIAHTDAYEQCVYRGARKRGPRPKETDNRRRLLKGPVVAAHTLLAVARRDAAPGRAVSAEGVGTPDMGYAFQTPPVMHASGA